MRLDCLEVEGEVESLPADTLQLCTRASLCGVQLATVAPDVAGGGQVQGCRYHSTRSCSHLQ